MIFVAYLESLRSLSTPSRFARYASKRFKKSLSLGFESADDLEGARVVEALEGSMELRLLM